MSKLANDHIVLAKYGVTLCHHLGLLKFDNLLIVRRWEVVLTWRVRSHRDSILRLHLRLHAILPGITLLITCLDWSLTASHLSLLALDTIERCTSSDLALSILLAATSSDDLLAILILINLGEWTHRSLTLSIVVLTQKSIQVLRCRARSSILATHSLHLALVIR